MVVTSTGRGRRVRMLAGVALLACASVAGAESADAAAGQSSGMRAYADPRTGALRDTPPPGTTAPMPAAFSRSGAGLVETRAPGGGVMIELQGRFKSPLVATVAPDGTLHIDHGQSGE